jgi:hypothetical protein
MDLYCNSTALTMTDKIQLVATWQHSIPGQAVTHPFLNHGLLALVAMHLRHNATPSMQTYYAELAFHHQARGLALYIPQLQSVNEENCNGLFAFSSILAALCYSLLQSVDSDLHGDDYIAKFVNNFDYLLGSKAIAHSGRVWIRQGNLSAMFSPRTLQNTLADLVDSPQRALQGLLDHVDNLSSSAKDQEQQEASPKTATQPQGRSQATNALYRNSIERLTNAFPKKNGLKPLLSAVIGWPAFLDPEFIELLRQKDAVALVILAHYGVAIHGFNSTWWLKDIGARLVSWEANGARFCSGRLLRLPLKTAILHKRHEAARPGKL